MKYFSGLLLLVLLGCSDIKELTVNLKSTQNNATVSVANGEAVFKQGNISHKWVVSSRSGSSFLLELADGSLKSNLTFDYQKETDTWLCATCVQLDYPLSWKKI